MPYLNWSSNGAAFSAKQRRTYRSVDRISYHAEQECRRFATPERSELPQTTDCIRGYQLPPLRGSYALRCHRTETSGVRPLMFRLCGFNFEATYHGSIEAKAHYKLRQGARCYWRHRYRPTATPQAQRTLARLPAVPRQHLVRVPLPVIVVQYFPR